MMRSWTVPATLVAVVHIVTAHTWIDCFDTNRTKIYDQSASYIYGGSGGNGFCEGYGAGYPGRGDTDIGTEYTFKMLENEVEAGTAVCQTVDADTYTNTDWRKRISVVPGETVYFAYLPNGHIVKDKKAIGTQHGIYWTGEIGTSLTSTLEMTSENLMDGYTMDFDDGNCGESYDYNGNPGGRAGDGKPCIGSFAVPTGTAAGVYSMVWYWTFWLDNAASYVDQSQARGYFGAAYSTCFEVEVTSGTGSTETPSTEAPVATTAAPVSTTAAPMVTTAAPMVTTASPVSTTEAPVATTAAPLSTTAPAGTTAAPLATTAAPESASITSWDQVDTSTAAGEADLSATTSTPVASTSAPQVTTAAPQVTTPAPVATEAPVAVTVAPVATTSAPVVATTSPPVPTSAPAVITDAPTSEVQPTTAAPQMSTAPPAATPAILTAAPQTTSPPTATTPTESPETDATSGAAFELPETDTDSSTRATESPDTDTTSGAFDDSFSSMDSATFASLADDENSVGTVHAASTSSSVSATGSESSSSGNSIGSDTIDADVGSGSFDIDPEVSYDSESASAASEESAVSSSSSASSSTASASTNAETSFSMKTSELQPRLVLLCLLVAGAAAF